MKPKLLAVALGLLVPLAAGCGPADPEPVNPDPTTESSAPAPEWRPVVPDDALAKLLSADQFACVQQFETPLVIACHQDTGAGAFVNVDYEIQQGDVVHGEVNVWNSRAPEQVGPTFEKYLTTVMEQVAPDAVDEYVAGAKEHTVPAGEATHTATFDTSWGAARDAIGPSGRTLTFTRAGVMKTDVAAKPGAVSADGVAEVLGPLGWQCDGDCTKDDLSLSLYESGGLISKLVLSGGEFAADGDDTQGLLTALDAVYPAEAAELRSALGTLLATGEDFDQPVAGLGVERSGSMVIVEPLRW